MATESKMNRREAMIGLGHLVLGAVTLPNLLRAERAVAATPAPRRGKAKSCILIFLWGGPPHQDMFDLKSDAPDGIRSLFKPIKTNVPGIEVCDQMPLVAKQADKMCIVRSVTHKSDAHEPSVYHILTGKVDPTMVIPRNNRKRTNAPGISGIISCLTETRGNVPTSVTIPRPIQHDGIKYAGTHAGFLGAQYDPMELPDTPLVNGRPVLNFEFGGGVNTVRLVLRHGLLNLIESQERAFSMIASPATKRAFNLDLEKPATRDRYGRNHYCEAFLLARRLIEAGVRLVSVNWMYFRPDANPLNPWDNHGGTPALGNLTGYDMLKAEYCLPSFDRAYSALLEDLAQRGMLEETLVVVMGEFGRTPKINATAGRDHWGACGFATLAGGGIRGGQVYGESDAHAAYVKDNPVSPEDLLATIYHAFGIAPDTGIHDLEGRPHKISEGKPLMELFG